MSERMREWTLAPRHIEVRTSVGRDLLSVRVTKLLDCAPPVLISKSGLM